MGKKIFITLCLVFCMLVSCTSTRKGTDESILNYQREIDRLESELSARDRAIESSIRRLESITERSKSMEGTVDELIELFDEYQRGVEQLLYDYRKAGNAKQDKDKMDNRSVSYIDSKNHWNDCRLYYLRKRNQAATVVRYITLGGNYEQKDLGYYHWVQHCSYNSCCNMCVVYRS